MKRIIAAIILSLQIAAVYGLCAVAAQQPTPPLAPKKLTQAQQDHVEVAIKDFQLAQAQLTALQNLTAAARQKALDRIEEVKRELKLDETWDYDENQKAFVKRPEPPKSAEPAKK